MLSIIHTNRRTSQQSCIFYSSGMQLRHQKSIFPPDEKQAKVTAICWSPNNKRVAVVTVNRIVHLMDDQGNRKDKFSTKPGVKVRVLQGAYIFLLYNIMYICLIDKINKQKITGRAQDLCRARNGLVS